MKTRGPNLFTYATSELSQDAVLAWMLEWADSSFSQVDEATHRLGREFMALIFERHGKPFPKESVQVSVSTQDRRIDVLAIVNDEYAILIEDKAGTREHSDQLTRYLRATKEGFAEAQVLPTYVQTFEQSSYRNVVNKEYKVISRTDLLTVLSHYESSEGANNVALDLLARLTDLDQRFAAYVTTPISQWDWYAWQGFFRDLQRDLEAGGWGYVPNQSGGFLGFWWGNVDRGKVSLYLQLEQRRLCVKIHTDGDPDVRRKRRTLWHERTMRAAKRLGIPLRRPGRFGNGKTMTVAILDEEYRQLGGNERVDLDATVKFLHTAHEVVVTAMEDVDEAEGGSPSHN